MSKQKSKKKKSPTTKASAPKKTIAELITARDGGQIALKGYSYQLLYSCYLILSTADPNTSFGLEGIEDNDQYYSYPAKVFSKQAECQFHERYP